jgi:hypothetical protein
MPDVDIKAPFEAYRGSGEYAFVSYAHKDGAAVFPDITYLHEEGYRIWYDEGIDPGNEWPEEVAKALTGSSYFVVFVSPNAVDSSNVRIEINFALARKKPFLAIHIVETSLPVGLELQMGSIQAVMRFRMSEATYHRKLSSVLPLSLRLSEEQERQRREEEQIARDFVGRHRQAQAEEKRRAGQEAEICQILKAVIETRASGSFGVVAIRPGNEPREIEAVLETDIHPFSARELAQRGWTVKDWREGARLIVKVRDDAHIREIAQGIRFASEAP